LARKRKPQSGMASDALRRARESLERVNSVAPAAPPSGAWERQATGQGTWGRPGAERRTREYPVSEQQRMVEAYRRRDQANRKPSVGRAVDAYTSGESLSELLPVDLGVSPHTINPTRPRCDRGGYDSRAQTVRVTFPRSGAMYEYYEVPPNVWRQLVRARSAGRYIDRVLDTYPYARVTGPGAGDSSYGYFSENSPQYARPASNPGAGLGALFGPQFGGASEPFVADDDDSWTGYEGDTPDYGYDDYTDEGPGWAQ